MIDIQVKEKKTNIKLRHFRQSLLFSNGGKMQKKCMRRINKSIKSNFGEKIILKPHGTCLLYLQYIHIYKTHTYTQKYNIL